MLIVALPSEDLGPLLVMDAVARVRRQEGLPATPAAQPPLPSLGLLTARPLADPLPKPDERSLKVPQAWLASLSLPGWIELGEITQVGADWSVAVGTTVKGHDSVLCCGPAQAGDALQLIPSLLSEWGGPLPTAVIPTKELWPAHALDLARQHLTVDSLRLAMAAEDVRKFHILDNPWEAWFDLVLSPDSLPPYTNGDREFHAELQRLWDDAQEHRNPQTFSLKRQVQVLEELALRGLHFAERHAEPNLAATSLAVFARLAEPIMPELASALADCLGTTLKADPECRPLQNVTLKPLATHLSTRQDALALQVSRIRG